jgi:TRAP-type C4-dicarboxylate transport system permease small subunit
MEALYFTIVGVILYLGADWVLNRIEARRGSRFEHRSIVFFVILLSSALIVFSLIETLAQ